MLTQIDVPNLLNGISSQPDSLRLPSQAQTQVNFMSDIVKGLRRRPGTNHLMSLTGLSAGSAFHLANRDSVRRYIMGLSSAAIRAWDLNALAPITLNNAVGNGYISGTGLAKDYLKFLTVADYTFVLNTQKTVAMTSAVTARPNYSCLIYVASAPTYAQYTIKIDGVIHAQGQYNADTANRTLQVADLIFKSLSTGTNAYGASAGGNRAFVSLKMGTGWLVQQHGNVIYLEKLDGTNFTVDISDDFGNTAIILFKDTALDSSKLPPRAKDTFKININGIPKQGGTFDNFWLQYTDQAGQSSGVWNESIGYNEKTTLDNTTMPHAIVINTPATSLTYQRLTYKDRTVGDITSAPLPSFIGQSLNDIFFYRNRLGLAANENILFTQSSGFFNWFPTTVTDQLDNDMIDVGLSHTKVAVVKSAVPVAERLVLFSEHVQFLDGLAQNSLLTPKTVAFHAESEYEVDVTKCRPEVSTKSVFFPQKFGLFSRIYEMFPKAQNSGGDTDAVDVTEHTPDFIPRNVRKMQVHQATDSLYLISDDQPNRIYVYRYLWQDRKRVQASWSYWDFSGDGYASIENIFVVDGFLYLIRNADGITDYRLQSIDLSFPQDFLGSTPYHVCLDHKVQLTGTYNATTDTTTWTLPATWALGVSFGVVKGIAFTTSSGQSIPGIKHPTTTTVTAPGNISAGPCIVGVIYTSTYTLSKQYTRGQNGDAVVDGRTELRTLALEYKDSGYFAVDVTAKGRATRTYEMLGVDSSSTATFKIPPIVSGEFAVPVATANVNATLTVRSSSPYPLTLSKARLPAVYTNPKKVA